MDVLFVHFVSCWLGMLRTDALIGELLGANDQRNDDDQDDEQDEASKNQCHLKILPSHLLAQIRRSLLEDGRLFIELVGLFCQRFGLLGVLEHVGDVVLHGPLDGIDLAQQCRRLVDLGQILVLAAHGLHERLGLLGQRVCGSRLGGLSVLLHEVLVQLGKHLDCHPRRVLCSRNDRAADGIRIGTVDDLMLIGLDDLEPSDLSRGSQAARWVVGNHPRHGIRVGTVTATVKIAGSSVRFVLSGMIELGENDRLGAAAVLNAVDEGATEFVIGHGCCC
mmetsp:Transcript_5848/g.17437  ORF Transcript_5848/g.17437 Transcript_5848/m.17437 type:complete len:278 (-) Transcript_5848:103-936(-)